MTDTPSRQPIFNVPRVVILVIVGLALVHAARLGVSDAVDARILARFAFVPGRLTMAVDPEAVMRRVADAATRDGDPDGAAAVGRFFLGDGSPQPWTLLTYALLHGSWTHFGLNAIWLLAFGAPVARRLGPLRFLLLLAVSAVAGALGHTAVDPFSLQPLVGASAAVSGCMGAALRFMFRPVSAPLDVWSSEPAYRARRRPLAALVLDRRAAAFLAVWFVSDIVMGIAAVPLGLSDAPVAWQAHIGGFLLGLLAFPLFDPLATASEPGAETAA